jgi:hypothetical protein
MACAIRSSNILANKVKALDFQMQGSCKAWAFEETILFRCDGVIAGLKQRLKVFRVFERSYYSPVYTVPK